MNDAGASAATDLVVQRCMPAADAVIRLPARMAIEALFLDGIPDPELVRVFRELSAAFGDLALPANWDQQSGADLRSTLKRTLHDRPGSLHASFIWELNEATLPARAIEVLECIRRTAGSRTNGLVEL